MNTYHEGKYYTKLLSYKKYYKMAGICFSALCFYLFIKKEPTKSRHLARHTADFVKFMPMDRHTSGFLNPILDFTAKQYGNNYGYEERIQRSGGHGHMQGHMQGQVQPPTRKKRSVSETKKKYVASKQNWNCGHCKNQLSAWFEVDHIMSLENGGTNEVDNLVALCRECHGEKTAMEHL
tara:strand:- start:6670 stop:7206 length:537 start_codon:yes stop_codon:yes gene_type:complete